MGLLSRLLHGGAHSAPQTPQLGEAVERIAGLSPQLRLARRYQARLGPAVAKALQYAADLVAAMPAPRQASAAVWSTDSYIHAFFAAPDDIAPALSRATDLRDFLERNQDLNEVYAVLGMAMTERHVLGVALEGETMRRDVPQTTVSFSDHRVRICGRSESELRQEIARRVVDQLGLDGVARIAAGRSRRDMLEQERALLKTRLQLLERQGAGMRSVVGADAASETGELVRLQEQIEENERNLRSLGILTEALDRDLDQLCAVLAEPGQHIYVESKHFRLNRMNVVLPENSAQTGEEVTFHVARIPTTPPQMRAFSLVRIARDELLPAPDLLAEATRLLH